MSKNLYVGNLASEATEQQLRDLFSQAGEISELKIISDMSTGESRGFGFVEMATDEGSQEAVTRFNGYNLASRDMVVNVARPRPDRRGGGPRR